MRSELEIRFEMLPEFEKDFKKLSKRFCSLQEDLELRKKVLRVFPTGRGNDAVQIPGLKIQSKIYKTRLMCRTLKRESLRLIYSFDEELGLITLIEVYFKGDQVVESRERIFGNFE